MGDALPSGLRPFVKGDARAAEAGRRGAASKRARTAALRAEAEAVATELRRLAGSYRRDDLGPVAAAAALDAIGRVQRGEWKVRDPADWVRVLVDVARLESGEPTSAAIVAHVSRDVVALRDEARAALGAGSASSTVLAADDVAGTDGAALVVDADVGGSDAASLPSDADAEGDDT